MLQAKDLQHFRSRIMSVQQWTGQETKEMVKQFLPISAEDLAFPKEFVKMVGTLLDFLYFTESVQLSEDRVNEMDEAPCTFHSLKTVLVKLKIIIALDKFDHIPKFHMLGHCTHPICEPGTPEGYNTESPKHLHIIYSKCRWHVLNWWCEAILLYTQ